VLMAPPVGTLSLAWKDNHIIIIHHPSIFFVVGHLMMLSQNRCSRGVSWSQYVRHRNDPWPY
jgi:hypothetical protein